MKAAKETREKMSEKLSDHHWENTRSPWLVFLLINEPAQYKAASLELTEERSLSNNGKSSKENKKNQCEAEARFSQKSLKSFLRLILKTTMTVEIGSCYLDLKSKIGSVDSSNWLSQLINPFFLEKIH